MRVDAIEFARLCRTPNYAEPFRFPQVSWCPAYDRFGIIRPVPPLATAEMKTMKADEYLSGSRLFRRLKSGPHGELVELYAARLVNDQRAGNCTWRCLNLVGELLSWLANSGSKPTDLDERMVDAYFRHRAGKLVIQKADRAALRRLLSVLREAGTIALPTPPPLTPHEQIFEAFSQFLREDRGLAQSSIVRHLPVIRLFLREVCPAGVSDLARIRQSDVISYIERHARDGSSDTGKTMCWALRAFLRYLHHKSLHPLNLAVCVPSIRRWKLASLPTYLSSAQVQLALDGCDRATVMGRRDYAVLMMLAKLGLRAGEVAALALDDVDWRSGEMVIRAKGRQRARMPIPPDVGAAVVAYLRDGRPRSPCRKLFVRTVAPHIGFASGCSITFIAKSALARAGIRGTAHHGAHIFRHSLATELLRSGATLSQIGQLLRHESHDTTRIYAKVGIDALRSLSQPWPGGVQ
jgi:site-specific recombinase XerD